MARLGAILITPWRQPFTPLRSLQDRLGNGGDAKHFVVKRSLANCKSLILALARDESLRTSSMAEVVFPPTWKGVNIGSVSFGRAVDSPFDFRSGESFNTLLGWLGSGVAGIWAATTREVDDYCGPHGIAPSLVRR